MSASSYDEALARLLVHEGGYSNHPADPGGPTNWGITLHDARAYWKADATTSDVRAMSVDVAKKIYRERYWSAIRGDDLPAGVDYAVFDYGVNSGVGRAAKVLQQLVGVSVDGEIGDDTVAAAAKADPKSLVNAVCDERLAFLEGLRTWSVFGNGWAARVREVRAAALAMAKAAPAVPAKPPATTVETPPAASSGLGVLLRALLDWFIGRRRPTIAVPTVPPGPKPGPVPGADGVPPWLATMRILIGAQWSSGAPPASIRGWKAFIAQKYPDMADYIASAGQGYFAWCGLTVAYCLARADIRPVFGTIDVERFLWADAWRKFGQVPDTPQPGDVLVFDFGGGDHHVTLLEKIDGDEYVCLGGNQSHQVKLSRYPRAQCIAVRSPS